MLLLQTYTKKNKSLLQKHGPLISFLSSALFFCYNFIMIMLYQNSALWFSCLAVWYLVMMLSKVYLVKTVRTGDNKYFRLLIIAAGVLAFLISLLVFFWGQKVRLTSFFVVANGIYALGMILYRFFLLRNQNRSDPSYLCRTCLALTESLFAVSLIFYKLISAFQWDDLMLNLMACIYGLSISVIIIIRGMKIKPNNSDLPE